MSAPRSPQPPLDPDDPEAQDAARAAEFAAALEAFERARPAAKPAGPRRAAEAAARSPRVGERVLGKVVSISGDSVLMDVGGRSEGVADAREFRAEDGTLNVEVGQELELFVREASEPLVLARTARTGAGGKGGRVSLEAVRQAREAGMPVRGKVSGVNTGGVTVDVDGVRAFCPISQLDSAFVEDAKPYVGRVLEFVVTEVDESRVRVVVSRKKLLQREAESRAQARLAALAPGQELDGKVTRLEPFGAFVDLGGIDGLVHVSELSHARLSHPREAVGVGDTLRMKVLKLEPGKDGRPRVALSARAAAPDPWATAAQRFTPGMRVPGVVVRLTDFGAFVNLAPGVDGLVHVSQISERRIVHARDVLAPGQAVEAIVLAVEPERRRISLSLKDAAGAAATESRVQRDEPASAEPEPPAAPAPAADTALTPMQLAFRRARESQERRSRPN